jgi:hypothetical protein
VQLRDKLHPIPGPRPLPSDTDAIADSLRYLGSDAAVASIAADVYWPKWDSPWWHMLALFEAGEVRRIPERAVSAMVRGLAEFPVKVFPAPPDVVPAGTDPTTGIACHCQLGTMYQVLAGCGIDVDRAVPWFAPWFVRYQMADGGLNCDDTAYACKDECPSSMVGTIAPFEAMTLGRPEAWSAERARFVDRAVAFLIERQLRLGSPTVHNAEEREAATRWPQLCFPRFYFYDVLRGLAALASWAAATRRSIPRAAIDAVVDHLVAAFPDGVVRLQRQGYAGTGTIAPRPEGGWGRKPASMFPLLVTASAIGRACPYLTAQWTATRRRLVELDEAGLVLTA